MNNAELLHKWLNDEVSLECFDYYTQKWKRFNKEDLPNVRVREINIETPETIYVNIYTNGKMYAHETLKEALNSIEDGWESDEYITIQYRKDAYVP